MIANWKHFSKLHSSSVIYCRVRVKWRVFLIITVAVVIKGISEELLVKKSLTQFIWIVIWLVILLFKCRQRNCTRAKLTFRRAQKCPHNSEFSHFSNELMVNLWQTENKRRCRRKGETRRDGHRSGGCRNVSPTQIIGSFAMSADQSTISVGMYKYREIVARNNRDMVEIVND